MKTLFAFYLDTLVSAPDFFTELHECLRAITCSLFVVQARFEGFKSEGIPVLEMSTFNDVGIARVKEEVLLYLRVLLYLLRSLSSVISPDLYLWGKVQYTVLV